MYLFFSTLNLLLVSILLAWLWISYFEWPPRWTVWQMLQISPLPFQPSIAHLTTWWWFESLSHFPVSLTAWIPYVSQVLPQRYLPERFAKWKWGGCHASRSTHNCRVLFLWSGIHSGPCLKLSLNYCWETDHGAFVWLRLYGTWTGVNKLFL